MTRGVKAAGSALEVIELLGGGKMRRDPLKPSLGWVTCPNCGKEQHHRIPSYGDQRLQSYRGQCRTCQNQSRRKTGTQSHRSGAILLYDERHPQDVNKTRFLCPGCCSNCEKKHYVRVDSVSNPAWNWSGRCEECRLRESAKVINLPSGGTFRRDPDNTTHGWATCPDCPEPKEERYIPCPSSKEIENGIFTGHCKTHGNAHRRKLTGTKQHRSGATILYDEPDPERPHNERSAFLCANPDHNSECLVKSYAWFNQFHDPTWRGLCQNCLSKQPSPRKIVEDLFLYDGPNGKSTVIHYSRREEPGRVSVTYWRCKHTIQMGREVVGAKLRAHRTGKRPWSSICYPCDLKPEVLAEALEQIATQNGNGQKNEGAEKRSRGHQPGDLVLDRGKLKAGFESVVNKLKETLPPHKILRCVIAAEYNRRGEAIHVSTITKRVQLIYGDGVNVADAVARVLGTHEV